MTERYARDPDPGLADRIAAWLFPSLYPDPPEGQVVPSARVSPAPSRRPSPNSRLSCDRAPRFP